MPAAQHIGCVRTASTSKSAPYMARRRIKVNETKIEFSNEEIAMLNKGLKYSLSHKKTHWLSNLAFEAENAITLLPTHEKGYLRYQVAQNLLILYKQQKEQHTNPNREAHMNTRL